MNTPSHTYDEQKARARARLAAAFAPQDDRELKMIDWLLSNLIPPEADVYSAMVERRVVTSQRAATMDMAQRTLDRWEPQESAPANEVTAMDYLASGGDPTELPKPLREWGTSRAHQVADAYDNGWREGIEHARTQQSAGIDPELWTDQHARGLDHEDGQP